MRTINCKHSWKNLSTLTRSKCRETGMEFMFQEDSLLDVYLFTGDPLEGDSLVSRCTSAFAQVVQLSSLYFSWHRMKAPARVQNCVFLGGLSQ